MLKQEYPPTQVQPQSSATREDGHRELRQLGDYSALDKVDAEAGSILISLATQERCSPKNTENKAPPTSEKGGEDDDIMTTHTSMSINSLLASLKGQCVGSSRLTTDHYSQHPQHQAYDEETARSLSTDTSDPIMLLAAAAAAIDGRSAPFPAAASEPRPTSSTLAATEKRGFYSQYYTSTTPSTTSTPYPKSKILANGPQQQQQRVQSSRDSGPYYYNRHRNSEALTSATAEQRYHQQQQGTSTNIFSYQYMTMTQNPRIKRNAMHAYITYMIYADMTRQERGRTSGTNKPDGRGAIINDDYSSQKMHKSKVVGESDTNGRIGATHHSNENDGYLKGYPRHAVNGEFNHNIGNSNSRMEYGSNEFRRGSAHGIDGLITGGGGGGGGGAAPPIPKSSWYNANSTLIPSSSSYHRLPPSSASPSLATTATGSSITSQKQQGPPSPSAGSNTIMMSMPLTAFLRDGGGAPPDISSSGAGTTERCPLPPPPPPPFSVPATTSGARRPSIL
ncbi:hypothetical protein BX666DRAFT_1013434 [Dichotomocladium elegans]|nr:hypothetical protein BX666DRAFT_1013434 [Dichotomocladium elegans]